MGGRRSGDMVLLMAVSVSLSISGTVQCLNIFLINPVLCDLSSDCLQGFYSNSKPTYNLERGMALAHIKMHQKMSSKKSVIVSYQFL